MASGERERSLQRQLLGLEMRLEEGADARGSAAASEQEGVVQRLLEQRSTANAALQVRVGVWVCVCM